MDCYKLAWTESPVTRSHPWSANTAFTQYSLASAEACCECNRGSKLVAAYLETFNAKNYKLFPSIVIKPLAPKGPPLLHIHDRPILPCPNTAWLQLKHLLSVAEKKSQSLFIWKLGTMESFAREWLQNAWDGKYHECFTPMIGPYCINRIQPRFTRFMYWVLQSRTTSCCSFGNFLGKKLQACPLDCYKPAGTETLVMPSNPWSAQTAFTQYSLASAEACFECCRAAQPTAAHLETFRQKHTSFSDEKL